MALKPSITCGAAANTNRVPMKRVDFEQFDNTIKELGLFWAVINEPPPGSAKRETTK
jgi:hypothetical protein